MFLNFSPCVLIHMASVMAKGTYKCELRCKRTAVFISEECKEDISPYNISIRADLSGSLCPAYVSLVMNHLSLVLRKPVFGVSDQVPHKPGCATTEDGYRGLKFGI